MFWYFADGFPTWKAKFRTVQKQLQAKAAKGKGNTSGTYTT